MPYMLTVLRPTPHLVIFTAFLLTTANAEIDLRITRPAYDYTTTNRTLAVEGDVTSSDQGEIVVSIDTPAGVARLSSISPSVHTVTTDLGGVRQLQAVLIRPSVDRGKLIGPRRILLAISEDGPLLNEHELEVSANADAPQNPVVVRLPNITSARFVRIEMLEGWSPGRILIESIEFLGIDDQIIHPIVSSVSILLDRTSGKEAPFTIELLLSEGENEIFVTATRVFPQSAEKDVEEISVRFLSDLQSATLDERRLELSDGDRANISVPIDKLDSSVKKIQFIREPLHHVNPSEYQDNTRIAPGTLPLLVYRFEVLKRANFGVEATSSLSSQPPMLAVDGILEPPSTWMAGLVPLPIHLTVDLGEIHTLGQITVHANVVNHRSYGPQRGTVLVSNDGHDFREVLDVPEFSDGVTVIEVPAPVSCRYVRLLITESKQANNVQLNEVQFFDSLGLKISRFAAFNHLLLERPALLEFNYDRADLADAGVNRETDLRVFAWIPSTHQWQLAGGEVDPARQKVRLELNYISRFALFQAVPPTELEAQWSLNPFSPDGNGVADVTQLIIPSSRALGADKNELVVEIYDLHSKLVKTLINRSTVNSNSISIEWDGTDRTGRPVNIGPYIYQVRMGTKISNGVIVVAK
ncbi:MAG: discoidin domain-containing protein [Candidatus Poribacteria bacterium]|nr:discoidin domain-containing protein [Candidatus Poribacteria bacterium]MDE0505467.1 discoidin domain-containing protein [Candidatus Poribacteria bacterium]